MKARVHVYVSGFVQGVFFRHETKKHADRLGVKGWVRNLPDGRVEAVFEGDQEAVEEMLKFCKKGSLGAKVKNVEVNSEEWRGEFQKFSIRY
ncbi:acylphosphatase [Candidatus Bathyarchaeota archaeon]|nr:acylphosphatase [Candidatus Bathyarchaeota archaeon]